MSEEKERGGWERERERERDPEGSVENGVLLAGCDHAEGEKSGCQDFPSLFLFLSFSLTLSLPPCLSRFLLQKEGCRNVVSGRVWLGPPLRVALAKKRGQEEGRRKIGG